MRKLNYLIMGLLLAGSLHAQTIIVSGQVGDTSERKPLFNAIVSILTRDSILLKYTRTDASGHFQLTVNTTKPLLLMVSYPKFADFLDEIKPDGSSLDVGKINLIKKSVLLEEVIVSQKIGAIRMRGDTLEFKADSFAVRQGANVEELLKKLPGLQVNKKGEITAQGEKVQKVLVDGEEFFSDDPAVVTQNLRADAIDKVQVFDKKSDQAAFTGVDDGEKQKTINLQMKEDRKKGYFGKAKIAGGLPGYFENEAMANLFKGKRKIAAYGTMANTGKAGLDWSDNNKFSGGDNVEFNEEEGYFYSYNEGDEFNTWGGRYNGEGLPKAWTAGAHYSNKWLADKRNLNANYQYYKQDILNEGTNITQYILPDTLYFSNQLRKTNTLNDRHQFNGFYDVKLDSLSSLKVTANGSLASARNESQFITKSLNEDGQPVNGQLRDLFSTGEKQQSSISAIWRKKFARKGRTISIAFDHKYSNNQTDGQLMAINSYYNSAGLNFRNDTIDQKKDNFQQSNIFNGKISYTEPLSKKWFVEINYGYRINNSSALKSSYNKDQNGKYQSLDSIYSSDYAYDINSQSGGLNFRFNGDKITASFGSNLSNASYKQTDLEKDTTYRYNFVNLFPKANIRFKMGAQRGLRFSYNGSTRQPTLQQIQPIAENTDPLNIQVGNPNLKQEFRHNFNAFFNDYKVLTSRNIYLNGGMDLVENAISGNDFVDSVGRRVYQFVNVNGNINYFLYGGYWFQLKKLKVNINSGLNANGGKINNFINGIKNTNTYYTLGGNLGAYYDKEKKFSMNIETRPSFTNSKSSVRPDIITKYWTVDNEFSTTVQLPYKFEVNSSLMYNWRQKTDLFGKDRNIWLWNGWLGKKFWKNDAGELRFIMNDILNQNVGYQRNAASNFVSENTYLTLKRYWLLSFTWNFSKNPGAK
ncbi:outer membrane beta-barrel family protein [Flavihumibacter profundi]|uniref:outer membrane beta-barrel family protein n=1 Tax=Flavihumibacter profundi TaxID=2716883 RepID=UPI001CC7A88B|nr:outer membrane beta-barrel family protein [Flavihumibacter profundi]MBZ5856195.1 outer membrane beta-barrel protein [Flavihumibacter profundi]